MMKTVGCRTRPCEKADASAEGCASECVSTRLAELIREQVRTWEALIRLQERAAQQDLVVADLRATAARERPRKESGRAFSARKERIAHAAHLRRQGRT
jgi:hypothetical protein